MSDSNFFHPSLTNISYSCVSLAVFRGEPDKNNIIISWKFHGSIVVILNRIPIENLGETLLPNIFPVFRPLITKKTITKIQKQKKKNDEWKSIRDSDGKVIRTEGREGGKAVPVVQLNQRVPPSGQKLKHLPGSVPVSRPTNPVPSSAVSIRGVALRVKTRRWKLFDERLFTYLCLAVRRKYVTTVLQTRETNIEHVFGDIYSFSVLPNRTKPVFLGRTENQTSNTRIVHYKMSRMTTNADAVIGYVCSDYS